MKSLSSIYGVEHSQIVRIALAYKNMLRRCLDKSDSSYLHYGGRGICVCQEWIKSRDAFMRWAISNGAGLKGITLDRINVDGHYQPENCRWISIRQQHYNKRLTKKVVFMGQETTIGDLVDKVGVSYDTMWKRIYKYKLPPEKWLVKDNKAGWKHGTRAGYEGHGCRCEKCKQSNNARHRSQRAKRRIAGYARCAEERCEKQESK